MKNEDVELNPQELFLGLAMVLHSSAGNIENKKMGALLNEIAKSKSIEITD